MHGAFCAQQNDVYVMKKSYFIFPITKGSTNVLMPLAGFSAFNKFKNHWLKAFDWFSTKMRNLIQSEDSPESVCATIELFVTGLHMLRSHNWTLSPALGISSNHPIRSLDWFRHLAPVSSINVRVDDWCPSHKASGFTCLAVLIHLTSTFILWFCITMSF